MGPDPTLPPHQPPPPASRERGGRRPDPAADRDLVLGVDPDQPPITHPDQDRAADVEHQQAAVRLHRELTDTAARVAERPTEDAEPLGRRLPVPLTGREGVER